MPKASIIALIMNRSENIQKRQPTTARRIVRFREAHVTRCFELGGRRATQSARSSDVKYQAVVDSGVSGKRK